MTILVVDKHEGMVVQKLTSPDRKKCFGYLALPENYDGTDISKVRRFHSLSEARQAIGSPKVQDLKLTPPKASYPQNQKGYRADSIRGKKAA